MRKLSIISLLILSCVDAQGNSWLEWPRNNNKDNMIINWNFMPCKKNAGNMQSGDISINKWMYQQNILINQAKYLIFKQHVKSQQAQIDMLKDVVKNKNDIIEYYRNQIKNKDEQIEILLTEREKSNNQSANNGWLGKFARTVLRGCKPVLNQKIYEILKILLG